MGKEDRTAVYDSGLRVEAYRLEGILRPFPSHFHQHYVIGLVEAGTRQLSCRGQTRPIRRGDVLLFQPGESHACTQTDGGALDYRCLNLPREVVSDLTGELTGSRELPGFSQAVIRDGEIASCLRSLHEQILLGSRDFGKEEGLLLLLSLLLRRYGRPLPACPPECREEVRRACRFMEEHYETHLSLAQVCRHAGLSPSTLLRAFTKAKGITPYRYLENIRIHAAKQLLEQGFPPVEAALRTGFSDQSHFTNYFTRLTGLSPGAYREIFLHTEER